MSELVRAALQDNAFWSRPRWYTVNSPLIVAPALGQQISLTTQFDPGREFLITSFTLVAGVNTDNGVALPSILQGPMISLQLTKQNSGKVLSIAPNYSIMITSNQTAPTELEDYIYMDGNEILTATATTLAVLGDSRISITYAGIEFLPKSAA